MFVYSAREFPFFHPAERNRLNKCKARVKKNRIKIQLHKMKTGELNTGFLFTV